MGRSALIHLLRSQSRRLSSSTFTTGYHHRSIARTWPSSSSVIAKVRFQVPSLNQRSWASSAAKPREDDDDHKISIGPQEKKEDRGEAGGVVYYGPISSTIKKVKLLSLSTCCLSVSLGPVITFMTSPGLNVIMKGAVASTVIFLSASTTAALHWFVSPYVHKLRWQPGSDTFEVEMMTWLATFTPKTLKFSDIRYPDTQRPYVSFKADGNYYFVDADHCPNKALLARLTPPKDAHDSAFKNLENVTSVKVKEAQRKVMVANHPDAGGSHFLASKINEAKDMMLDKTKSSGSAF